MTEEFIDGYMCRIAWECELGAAFQGSKIFPSIDSLKNHHKCTDDCGIVKVRVQLLSVVDDGEVL